MDSPTHPLLVLMGPAGTGKTVLGNLVAEALKVPFTDLDAVAEDYYREAGWSLDRLVERSAEVGRVAAEREWEPARAHAVARVVRDHPNGVIALGAGHGSYTDRGCLDVVRRALSAVPHVLLVLPSQDRGLALAELRRRCLADKGSDWISGGHDFLAEWFDDPGARSLATSVVVTEGEDPGTTAARLARLVGPAGSMGPVGPSAAAGDGWRAGPAG